MLTESGMRHVRGILNRDHLRIWCLGVADALVLLWRMGVSGWIQLLAIGCLKVETLAKNWSSCMVATMRKKKVLGSVDTYLAVLKSLRRKRWQFVE